jgi:hypothetical protein
MQRANKMKLVVTTAMIIVAMLTGISTYSYAQMEEQEPVRKESTKTIYELSCELIPDSGLLCGNSDLDLCLLRTDMSDVNVSDTWNLEDFQS